MDRSWNTVRRLAPVVTLAALTVACATGAQAAPRAGAGDELCRLESKAGDAVMAHDRAFLSSLFADEFTHTNYRGGTVDKAGELDFYSSPEFRIQAVVVSDCQARTYGRAAVVTGIDTWKGAEYKGTDLSGSYRFTRVYVWRDHRWQVVASHASKMSVPVQSTARPSPPAAGPIEVDPGTADRD